MANQMFDIHFGRQEGGAYGVRVTTPRGSATGTFVVPLSDADFESFVRDVGWTRKPKVRRVDTPPMTRVRAFGGQMYQTLFAGEIGERLHESLAAARSEGHGITLRLHLRETPELALLPWEYLYDAARDSFLALSNQSPILRFLSFDLPDPPQSVRWPLRILGVVSSPTDLAALDTEVEKDHLERALQELAERGLAGALEVHWLDRPTLGALQDALREGEYHIFHYVGHGQFETALDEGALIFEDEHGLSRRVTATALGALLRDHVPLRLALLNACEGARTGREDPFAGVGPALVRAGLPAAIAMQFEVTDEAALTFAREFYGALVDGYPVQAAVTEARKSIFSSGNPVEWGTPVLFSQVEDGRIFALPDRPPAAPAPVAPAPDEPAPSAATTPLPPVPDRLDGTPYELVPAAALADAVPIATRPRIDSSAAQGALSVWVTRQDAHWPTALSGDVLGRDLVPLYVPYWLLTARAEGRWNATIGRDEKQQGPCTRCGGSGSRDGTPCTLCDGSGRVEETKRHRSEREGRAVITMEEAVVPAYAATDLPLPDPERYLAAGTGPAEPAAALFRIDPAAGAAQVMERVAFERLESEAREAAALHGEVEKLYVTERKLDPGRTLLWLYPVFAGSYAFGGREHLVLVDGVRGTVHVELPENVRSARQRDAQRRLLLALAAGAALCALLAYVLYSLG